jgi:uncharacterized membrane protein
MPLWLSPPLVMLPKALKSIQGADAKCWIKLLLVHYGLWIASTAGTAKLFDLLENGLTKKQVSSITNEEKHTVGTRMPTMQESIDSGAAAKLRKKQMKLLRFWFGVTMGFHAAAVGSSGAVAAAVATPAIATSTVAALSAGNMLPKDVKKVVHPLLVAAFITALSTLAIERLRKSRAGECETSWIDSLSTFVKGPGDSDMRSVYSCIRHL